MNVYLCKKEEKKKERKPKSHNEDGENSPKSLVGNSVFNWSFNQLFVEQTHEYFPIASLDLQFSPLLSFLSVEKELSTPREGQTGDWKGKGTGYLQSFLPNLSVSWIFHQVQVL